MNLCLSQPWSGRTRARVSQVCKVYRGAWGYTGFLRGSWRDWHLTTGKGINKFENGRGISLVLEESDSIIWYIWRNDLAFWNRQIQFWISKPQFTPRISFFFASAPNLVCYTWPVVCVFTKRSLGMSLSSSYQLPHGSVIKFCQFPCSAVFVVDEMTCTLRGKDETALYSLGQFQFANSHWEWDLDQNKAGHCDLVPPPHPTLLILSTVFYNEPGLRTKDIFLNLCF